MCGIVGFTGNHQVVYDIVLGLTSLQHRGQDAAGIVTFKDYFHIKKGLGLVSQVFEERHFKRLQGNIGLGHVRYTTQGSNELQNAQPFSANYPFGLAMVHNGNVTNFKELRNILYNDYHILPETSNDLELILYVFASELIKKDLKDIQPADIFEAVKATQQMVKGAYSVIAVIANHGLLAFTDPHGIRPLVLGRQDTIDGTMYGFASESSCFDYLGYELVRDLEAGEIIFIDNKLRLHTSDGYRMNKAFCIFEHIYFAREDSIIQQRLVAAERVKMGRMLAKKVKAAGLQPDIVIDVPTSGYFAASGLAEALGIPYRRGFVKNSFIGRSFISPTQKEREEVVKKKLNPIKAVVEGKRVAVVDDSIVRGTTSKRIVKMLRNAGAAEVYFISAAPPITNPCVYGIDMAISTELIASRKTHEEICSYIGSDALVYQTIEDLQQLYTSLPCCYACFTGNYPVEDSAKLLSDIEQERMEAKA
ncbi:amidophosphoribosyltransferase [Sphingobacteriales bacterium UPWRP_1]|nr:amidophosphoribosyltransferase [Sphingobacteriales bacterium TSM_CSM]PSJ73081.1 amidophosphoribosyltransferase [Sphingobacteriales bacterium UPWRP_1]